MPLSTNKLGVIRDVTSRDSLLMSVMDFVMKGWPSSEHIPIELKSFYDERSHLSVQDGLLI